MAAGKGASSSSSSRRPRRTIAGYLGRRLRRRGVGRPHPGPQDPSELPPEMKKGPFGKFAIDVDNGFEAYYVVDGDKKKKVAELEAAAQAGRRALPRHRRGPRGQGHRVAPPRDAPAARPVKRMVFHEITREAIQRAVTDTRARHRPRGCAGDAAHPRPPLRVRGVAGAVAQGPSGTSAGRVQSVATRMVVERERERMAFRAASYWDVEGEFTTRSSSGALVESDAFTAGSAPWTGTASPPVATSPTPAS